jgi:putative oxidoreductase
MKTENRVLDISLLIARLFLATVVGAHGAQKLLGWYGGYGFEGTMSFFTEAIGLPYVLGFLIILAESLGMVALLTGLFTRLLSSSLILIMVGAILTTHGQNGFFMNWSGAETGEGYEFHLLVIGLSAMLALNGAGAYGADRYIRSRLFQKNQSNDPSFI